MYTGTIKTGTHRTDSSLKESWHCVNSSFKHVSSLLKLLGVTLVLIAKPVCAENQHIPNNEQYAVTDFKFRYPSYTVSELMVLASGGDRLASLELSLRHSTGAKGAPRSQSASLQHYMSAARQARHTLNEMSDLPIDAYGKPAIRPKKGSYAIQDVHNPLAIMSLSSGAGAAPLSLSANASDSRTYNGETLYAWSELEIGSNTTPRFLGSSHNIDIDYPTEGEYLLRLFIMDERGNIDSDARVVTVEAATTSSPPSSVVRRQDALGITDILQWHYEGNSNSFDIRLLSATGDVLDSLTEISANSSCITSSCTYELPDSWLTETGGSVQIRSYHNSSATDWIDSNKAPIADAGPNRGLAEGNLVTLSGGNSLDKDGVIESYKWQLNGILVGEEERLSIQLPKGEHELQLIVTDNAGTSSSDFVQISVFSELNIAIGEKAGDVELILDALTVSMSQVNSQMTPIASAHGYVYIANIEHGPYGDEDGVRLNTVVRKGNQNTDGTWYWDSALVEDRTVFDKWHTAPSIDVDKDGQVHIAYNMHNVPWQYKRTSEPHNINSFEFLGQYISQDEIDRWKFENSTSFPTLGYAAIPGTQITYPRFEKDADGELYVSYRFATRPKRSWPERAFGAGIAEYSRTQQTWTAIGESLDLSNADYEYHPNAPLSSKPFAAKIGWTAYHPSLVFNNYGMGVLMFWRDGTAGGSTTKPCFAWSDNKLDFKTMSGLPLSLPLQPEDCSNLGFLDTENFYNIADSEIDSEGNIFITLNPTENHRLLMIYDSEKMEWSKEAAPNGVDEIFVDTQDNLWAVASGIKIYKRTSITGTWQVVYSKQSTNYCYPRATISDDGKNAFIHTQNCNLQDVSVFGLRLEP